MDYKINLMQSAEEDLDHFVSYLIDEQGLSSKPMIKSKRQMIQKNMLKELD